ncbi:hypothetical protein PO124_03860 [Bacillus licheniformis]|nr:hypothetical protein [Bacillus licheniformis]
MIRAVRSECSRCRSQKKCTNKYDLEDPLHEDEDSPVPGLTHRYPDRVCFSSLINARCIADTVQGGVFRANRHGRAEKQLDQAIGYIRDTPDVRDVLISGGDGLLINDQILEYI